MDDNEIIGLYFARSERALTETAARYGGMIKSVAYNILKNAADAEECENDVYMAAWNKIPPERPEHLAAFLGRVARNIAINKYAYYNAAKRGGAMEQALCELDTIVSGAGSPQSECEAAETASYINEYLAGIKRANRVVFVKRYWYCAEIREIAAQTGFSEGKIKSMLMRTRNGLKKYLIGKGVEL